MYSYTDQTQIRDAFWNVFCVDGKPREYRGKTQNQLPVDVRMAFVDFVDHLQRDGSISEALAARVTLTAGVFRRPLRCGAIVKRYPGEYNDSIGAAHKRAWYERTGEFRAPRAGEFYLSGAIPCAYRAPNDLGTAYHIMRPVALPPKRVTVAGFTYLLEGPC